METNQSYRSPNPRREREKGCRWRYGVRFFMLGFVALHLCLFRLFHTLPSTAVIPSELGAGSSIGRASPAETKRLPATNIGSGVPSFLYRTYPMCYSRSSAYFLSRKMHALASHGGRIGALGFRRRSVGTNEHDALSSQLELGGVGGKGALEGLGRSIPVVRVVLYVLCRVYVSLDLGV
eukprot:1366874-Amorphochlora_amoeboformis.AAC.2